MCFGGGSDPAPPPKPVKQPQVYFRPYPESAQGTGASQQQIAQAEQMGMTGTTLSNYGQSLGSAPKASKV
jgi:hypothetical protein